jgi:L-lactate dehydrogenase
MAVLQYLLDELAEEFGVSDRSVHGQIIGEHGDSELAVWSQANIFS